jgi:hypothetical protein
MTKVGDCRLSPFKPTKAAVNLRNEKRDGDVYHHEYWKNMEFISEHLGTLVESLTSANGVQHFNCRKQE